MGQLMFSALWPWFLVLWKYTYLLIYLLKLESVVLISPYIGDPKPSYACYIIWELSFKGRYINKWFVWLTDVIILCCAGYIINSCPQIKLEGGLQWLHLADDVAVQCMMAHNSQNHMTTTTMTKSYKNLRIDYRKISGSNKPFYNTIKVKIRIRMFSWTPVSTYLC